MLPRFLKLPHRKFNNQIHIIRLNLCFVGSLISAYRAAFFASADDDVTLLCVDLREYRLKNSAAIGHTIAGVDVQMERMETEGAVIARRVTEGKNLFPAVDADKSAIVFCKKLIHFNT